MLVSPLADQSSRCDAAHAIRPAAGVEQIFFLASHVSGCNVNAQTSQGSDFTGCRANPSDARLVERYAREVQSQPTTSIWLFLYREGYDRFTRVQLRPVNGTPPCRSCIDGTSVWGERALWNRFPRLEEAVRTHPHIHKEEIYLRRFYWFHASLLMWLETFGHCHPRVKYLWRVESDVLFAGRLDQLIDLSSNDAADVLLPDLHMSVNGSVLGQASSYNHFAWQTFTDALPPERIGWSLVSIGRYSTTFLRRHMASRWEEGVTGYEEILLPTTCLNSAGCRLSVFNGWDSVAANRVLFRITVDTPRGTAREWRCDEFLEARNAKEGTLELWHPVKDRSCLGETRGSDHLCGVEQCPMVAGLPPAEAAANLRALRRRSTAWADRFREREMKERPFQAQRRERDRDRLAELQPAPGK